MDETKPTIEITVGVYRSETQDMRVSYTVDHLSSFRRMVYEYEGIDGFRRVIGNILRWQEAEIVIIPARGWKKFTVDKVASKKEALRLKKIIGMMMQDPEKLYLKISKKAVGSGLTNKKE